MKKFIKSICIGLLFLPVIISQKSIAEPSIVCCLENPFRDCAVVVTLDSDRKPINFNVAKGTKVRCPSFL